MKTFLLFLLVFTQTVLAADIKISQLPLGSAASTGVNDSFPFVATSVNITKRLTIWDLVNVPTMAATYATKANPVFTGTVTAPTFIGALTGNASTATALAANPTDCGSNTFAQSIVANGNLTCAAVSLATADTTGTLTVAKGGTGQTSSLTQYGLIYGSTTSAMASTAAGTSTQTLHGNASGAPTFSAVSLSSDITGTLGTANGGTGQASLLTQYGVVYASTTSAMASTSAGTSVTLLHGNASGAPTFGAVSLTADVTGTLATGNGGTGQTSLNSTVFTTLFKTIATAVGDIIQGTTAGAPQVLAAGTAGDALLANGAATALSYGTPLLLTVPPIAQVFTSGTVYNLPYTFIITSGSATVGATYTNNAITFTVVRTVASATQVVMSGSGPAASSGTLTKSGGTGDSTITFSRFYAPLYLEVEATGGGGGGAGSGTSGSPGFVGGNGTSTTFSSTITAGGGEGGHTVANGGVAAGGTCTISSPAIDIGSASGQNGGGLQTQGASSAVSISGSPGGNSPFINGAGLFANNQSGVSAAAVANSGGGGGGALSNAASVNAGTSGAGGGGCRAIILSPAATTYAIGAGGAVGAAGSGFAGGLGAAGILKVKAFYH